MQVVDLVFMSFPSCPMLGSICPNSTLSKMQKVTKVIFFAVFFLFAAVWVHDTHLKSFLFSSEINILKDHPDIDSYGKVSLLSFVFLQTQLICITLHFLSTRLLFLSK